MQSIRFLLFFAAFSLICNEKIFAESKFYLKSEVKLNQSDGFVYLKGQKFTGESVTLYSSGKKATSEVYKNGLRNGPYRKWYKTGVLSFESEYNGGKVHGVTKTWWPNGKMRSKTHSQNGVLNGKFLQWYSSGEKYKEMNYLNGDEEGMQRAWRRNGKLYSNYEFKNGRIFGLKKSNMCFELKEERLVKGSGRRP